MSAFVTWGKFQVSHCFFDCFFFLFFLRSPHSLCKLYSPSLGGGLLKEHSHLLSTVEHLNEKCLHSDQNVHWATERPLVEWSGGLLCVCVCGMLERGSVINRMFFFCFFFFPFLAAFVFFFNKKNIKLDCPVFLS